MKKDLPNKLVTGILLFGFIITGLVDLLVHSKTSYSSIMGMDTDRVYFYTFFLLAIGCYLLYHKWFVGIGFICLATFSSYFTEYISLHNYFASIAVYIGIIIDFSIRKKMKWLIPLVIIGLLQGLAFQTGWFDYYMVGFMEFLGLSVGSVFILKAMQR
ncbi:hypothetical protein [Roseivirga sp. UBA838]|uniref:hypothetical protein n=1 Tax=Roseivirga sp. UBA838 TaxID=1947393 RepID=UPI00258005C9|nr:hypothetical protein [Roseivirga sp. UBA838]